MIPDPNLVCDLSGGFRQSDMIAARIKTDGTNYDILNSSAVATSPTFPATPNMPVVSNPQRDNTTIAYSLTLLTDTQTKPTADGAMDIDFTNYEDSPNLVKCLLPFAQPNITTSQLKEYVLQDGTHRVPTGAGKDLLSINYLGYEKITQTVNVIISFGYLDPTSFAASYKSGEYSMPKVSFKGKVPAANITIPAAMFDSRLVTVSGPVTFYRVNGYYQAFLPKGPAVVG